MLDSLSIKNFRCFDSLQIESLGRVNLIVGKNNVGKSTLLEAMTAFSLCQSISDMNSAKRYLDKLGEFVLSRREDLFGKEGQASTTAKIHSLFHDSSEIPVFIGNDDSKIALKFCQYDDEPKGSVSLGFQVTVNANEYSFYLDQNLEITPRALPSGNVNNILNNAFNVHRRNYSFCDSNLAVSNELSKQLDLIKKEGDKKQLLKSIKIIDDRIEDIDFVSGESNSSHKIGILSLEGKKPLPLRTFGDGVSRLLKIMLHAYQAKKGYLLIDEFENGLHYSIQEEVWRKLFELADELDIQVFATTHSQDTIKSFCKVAVENKQIDGKLISLGRSAKTSNKDQIVAVEFDEDQLKSFIDSGMEVRG